MPVGRENAAFLKKVPGAVRQAYRHSSRQRHIAFVIKKTLAREMNRDERGRARGLNRYARPSQIELVRRSRAQKVFVVSYDCLKAAHQIQNLRVRVDVDKIGIRAAAREYAGQIGTRFRVITGVLDCLPRTLEKEPLLRIRYLGLSRVEAEERRVE